MGQNSDIAWCHHTLNFWWGCIEYSPGCEQCYAKVWSKRMGKDLWGPAQTTSRWRTSGPWKDCLKWDKRAKANGQCENVFVQSMSDFFEDHPQVEPWRQEAFPIIENFQYLNVLLLTKRIENVTRMVPSHWLKNWPEHVWMMTSVEDQKRANQRIPELLEIPAKIRGLSVEPMLGPIDLTGKTVESVWIDPDYANLDYIEREGWPIHWVIVGGESGANARPFDLTWARNLVDQCQNAGVKVFVKQLGSCPIDGPSGHKIGYPISDFKGEIMAEWPKVLRVQEFPK